MSDLYLLVTADPLLAACEDWRSRYNTARAAAIDYVRSIGSHSWMPSREGDVLGLGPIDPVPKGWRLERPRSRGSRPKMLPARGQAGDDVRAAIAALPRFPRQHEIAVLIGHPCGVSWVGSDGGTGFSSMGYSFDPVFLGWANHGGQHQFIIRCPDAAYYVQQVRDDRPGCTIKLGEWTLPVGASLITKARADLIYAEAAVARENAA